MCHQGAYVHTERWRPQKITFNTSAVPFPVNSGIQYVIFTKFSRIGEAHDQQEMKDIKVNKSQQIISKDLQGLLQFPTNTAGWWHALRPHHNDIASKKPWFYNPRPLPLCESSGQVSVVFLSHTHGHRCHSERPPGSNLRLRCDITLCRWIFDGRGTNVSSQWNLASACMPINTVDSYTQNQFSNM
ncbi:uncharacterized protein LOC124380928 isoform X6 [Silurus meridionalis]|uniref:uncharacterized protein LOC124380928 isoform X6 n=1 Tax=Silurus meridionalis TaxID=175797 RepID=UPI001EEB76BE|nr:uncharacterized protein LOC124380928 isoform X6 [Silurus meridionalis]